MRFPDRLPAKVGEEVAHIASRVRPAEAVQVDHQGLVALDQQLVAPEGAVAGDRRWFLVPRGLEPPERLLEGEGQRGCCSGEGRGEPGEIRGVVHDAPPRRGRKRHGVQARKRGSGLAHPREALRGRHRRVEGEEMELAPRHRRQQEHVQFGHIAEGLQDARHLASTIDVAEDAQSRRQTVPVDRQDLPEERAWVGTDLEVEAQETPCSRLVAHGDDPNDPGPRCELQSREVPAHLRGIGGIGQPGEAGILVENSKAEPRRADVDHSDRLDGLIAPGL